MQFESACAICSAAQALIIVSDSGMILHQDIRPVIAEFLFRPFAVFNGFFGTQVDAGHAVSAVCAPDRLFVLQRNVAEGAHRGAFPAADAFVGGRKSLRGNEAFVIRFQHHDGRDVFPGFHAGIRKLTTAAY